jgi:prolyl oligopeptidase
MLKYPLTRRDKLVVENHFGTLVSDPYRWLENPNSQETKQWVNKQNKLTSKIYKSI